MPIEGPTLSDPSLLSTGSAAELYEQHLVPLTFAEHSRVMASRFRDMAAGRLLEIAAGTGALTRELRKLLPDAVEIVATDLNQPMLDQARAAPNAELITWQQADVMALPFEDDSLMFERTGPSALLPGDPGRSCAASALRFQSLNLCTVRCGWKSVVRLSAEAPR